MALARLIFESGTGCLGSANTLRPLVQQAAAASGGRLDETEIAKAVAVLVVWTADPGASMWNPSVPIASTGVAVNVDAFVAAIAAECPSVDWLRVIAALDLPEFVVLDMRGLELIVALLRHAQPIARSLAIFWQKWKHPKGQVSFLRFLAQAPPDVIDIVALAERKVIDPASVASVNASTRVFVNSWIAQPWNSLDLIETVMRIANDENGEEAAQLLDLASRQCTEVTLLGLAQLKPPWSPLQISVVTKLTSVFVCGHSSSAFVLSRLWAINPQLVISVMVNVYSEDQSKLSRILDIAQELKALTTILDARLSVFSVDLAALAARREYLNLELWLKEKIQKQGNSFLRDCIDFVKLKSMNDEHTPSIPVAPETLTMFMSVLHANASMMSPETALELKNLSSKFNPKQPQQQTPDEVDASSAGGSQMYSQDIQEEASAIFGRLYNDEVSIEQIVDMMRRFKASSGKREQDIFGCMLQYLFEEYPFISKFPDKQLNMTGQLFGALINFNLFSPLGKVTALSYVLESLRRPAGSKILRFGLAALSQFMNRLHEMPKYCESILQVSHLHEAHPDVIKFVQQALQNAAPSSSDYDPNQTAGKPVQPANESAVGNGTVSSMPAPELIEPAEATRDKILFIINNVSHSNMDAKKKEMMDVLEQQYYRWFSQYLVVKRISIEPNFHPLYFDFLKALELKKLWNDVLNETYSNINVLLTSEKTLTSSQERTLLKNLGSWLGSMTLAQNYPILHKKLALKELLVESHEAGRLLVTIPFVCKVLEKIKDSTVFRPPNPWTVGVLRLLVELYHYADLKLNLKFEVEVMCKNIELDLKDIEPANVLRASHAIDVPASYVAGNAYGQTLADQNKYGMAEEEMMAGLDYHGGHHPPGAYDEHGNLSAAYTANAVAQLYATNPALKRLALLAVDRGVREVINPVVERAVSIAVMTTKEIVAKDFSSDPNEERLKRAAQIMVQNLAGNLAMVTSKEPFRIAMTTHLRALFAQTGFNEPMSENIITMIVQDNLEFGSSFIEKAAMEKSVTEIVEALAMPILARRRQRERGLPWTETFTNSRFPAILPEPLRARPGYAPQLRIYEDFLRPRGVGIDLASVPDVQPPVPYEAPVINPFQQIMDKFNAMFAELEKVLKQSPEATLTSLPPSHDVIVLTRQVHVSATQFLMRDELALWYAQKIVHNLYQSEVPIAIEVYILLLERVFEMSRRVAREVVVWLLYSDDERKYNIPVTAALIQTGIINVLVLDNYYAKQLESGRASIIEFVIRLVHNCICDVNQITTSTEFYLTLGMLTSLKKSGRIAENLLPLVQEIETKTKRKSVSIDFEQYHMLREKMAAAFEDWAHLCHNTVTVESEESFYKELANRNVITSDDGIAIFIRTSLEICIEGFLSLKNTPGGTLLAYQAIDSFARLIVMITKRFQSGQPNALDLQKAFFTKALSIFTLVLVHAHEIQRDIFDQKPFFRFLVTLLHEIKDQEKELEQLHFHLLLTLSNTLDTLQPLFVPGFTFAWLELICHRDFMPSLLLLPEEKGWFPMQKLLVSFFKFLHPFLKNAEMSEPIRILYKGALRVLLLLLHDFPEFLSDFHASFCDVIPSTCIQLRNLILSAFPKNMRLPDPFTPNLKVDLLPEISQPPRILADLTHLLKENDFLGSIESYMKTRGPVSFLLDLRSKLLLPPLEAFTQGTKYNTELINGLVLYVGTQAIQQMQTKSQQGTSPITHSAPMDIFQQLIVDLDTEGRYHFLNAVANQLRYPNSHTHYFSCVLLYLFAEANQEVIQEQITRVLLERLIVNRPHPWGLLITFIELLKNPRYNFWSHPFTRCAPDIERLFESVARSCMLPPAAEPPVQPA